MKVREAKIIAKQWVAEHAAHLPGFHGAYLAGGINRIPDDEPFPLYIDVDVHVILENRQESDLRQDLILYHNAIIESLYIDRRGYESPEAVLSNPLDAHNFLSPSVISDPTGSLTEIQKTVAHEYTCRKWVEARCRRLKGQIMNTLDDEEKSSSFLPMVLLLLNIPYPIANAHLKAPTNRRALCQIREILHAADRQELYESILAVSWWTHVSREETEFRLQKCLEAFDRAVQVFKTPFGFDYQIRPYVRPYILDGTQEMIQKGCYREATGWIFGSHFVANICIQNDAPEDEKKQFQEAYDRIYGRWNSGPAKDDILLIRRVVEDLFEYVDEVVASNPEIKD